ncbi:MAG: C45 family peptidase [Proteobacteria bacterium]|nr:C45 family peptidase [Pseudomonadota bacterium]
MKTVLTTLLYILITAFCCPAEPSVTIKKIKPDGRCGDYYEVVLDFDHEDDYQAHFTMGKKYAEAVLKAYYRGDYEKSISSYIRYSVAALRLDGLKYNDFMGRTSDLMEKFDDSSDEFYLYGAEIEGMASVMNSYEHGHVDNDNVFYCCFPENQLSLKEIFLINFFTDVFSNNGCTSLSVWDRLRPDNNPFLDGGPLVGKNTDFSQGFSWDGHTGKISSMHAVHYFKNQGSKKDVISIGFLGCLLVSEKGVNQDGLFVGENISRYRENYNESYGKTSVNAVMRHCLENFDAVDDASLYIQDGKSYAHGNLITLADTHDVRIVENSYMGSSIREYDSILRTDPVGVVTHADVDPPAVWNYELFEGPVLAATNSFQLQDQPENHRESSQYRLGTIESMMLAMDDDGIVTEGELIEILSQGERNGGQNNVFRTEYNATLQSLVYDPRRQTIMIHFAPCPFVVKRPALPDYIDLHLGFIGDP